MRSWEVLFLHGRNPLMGWRNVMDEGSASPSFECQIASHGLPVLRTTLADIFSILL
jgi:hypothetical protein